MAGRYSKEYRPNEFVKLPFEEIAKVMAMKEQQYQQGYLAHSAYQQEMGKQEDRAIDVDYSNFLMNNAKTKVENLVADTYGGDYGAGASDILRTLSNEANNPYYKMRKKLVEGEKLERDLEMKLNAEGKALAFKKDYTNKAYWDNTNNRANTDFKSDVQGKLDWQGRATEVIQRNLVDAHRVWEENLAEAQKHGTTKLGNKDMLSQYTNITEGKMLKDKDSAYNQFKSTPEYTQWKKVLETGYENGNKMNAEQADKTIKDTFAGMAKNMADVRYSRTVENVDATIPKETLTNGDGTKKTPYDDLDPKELPVNLDSDEIKEKINKVKQSGDLRKKIIREYLGTQIVSKWKKFEKDYGLSISNVNDKVNFLKKTLRDIESRPQAYGDIVNSKRKATEELNKYLDLQNKSKKYQGFDMSEADSVLKNNPSFQLLKSKYKTIYDKSKLAGESIDNFVDKVTALEQKAIIEPHNQYYTTNEGFNTGIDNDLRRANSVKTDEDIVNSDTGEKINYNRLIAKMDEGGSDGQKSAPYKFSVTDNGIVMHKGIESFVIPSKYFLPKTRYALNTAEKVLEQYKLYDNTTEDYASPQVVSLNDIGRKIIVFPGKGYKWLKGNNVTVSEGKDAITNGILPIEQLVDDVMNVVSNNYKK